MMNHKDSWDERYEESDQMWSGKVNAALAEITADLNPGTALDIGCGEGADVVWLAQHGWYVTGVDISHVAIQRAEQAAHDAGLSSEQAQFIAADVANWDSPTSYDLVTASFLHSEGEFDRAGPLDRAKDVVAPGGHLLVISHAEFPPWAKARHEAADDHEHAHEAATPHSELEILELDADHWSVELAELRAREATGPQGEQATLRDTVVLARRSA